MPAEPSHVPLTPLSALSVGKGSRYVGNATREEVWAIAKDVWGDNMPYRTARAIWGASVIDARSVEDCPECGFAGDIFLLCPYHESRQCPDCGGVQGCIANCTCP